MTQFLGDKALPKLSITSKGEGDIIRIEGLHMLHGAFGAPLAHGGPSPHHVLLVPCDL